MRRRLAVDSILRQLAETASGMLEPIDREAVCGDLAESGVSGLPALRDVLSLVIWRRAASLRNWSPWLALVCLAIPLGALLSLVTRDTADGSAIYLWLYANNSDWALLHLPGFWRELAECAPGVLLSYIALACWSWTGGLVLGCCGRRTLWFCGSAFFLVFFCVGIFGVPFALGFGHILVLERARDFHCNAAAFANDFYRWVFPQILEVLLVVLPAWRGMRQSARLADLPRVSQVVVLISSAATMGVLVTQSLTWWQIRVWNVWPLRLPRLPSLTPLAMVGPATWLLLAAVCLRRPRGCATQT